MVDKDRIRKNVRESVSEHSEKAGGEQKPVFDIRTDVEYYGDGIEQINAIVTINNQQVGTLGFTPASHRVEEDWYLEEVFGFERSDLFHGR